MTRRSHQTSLAGTLLLLIVIAGALGSAVCLVGSAAEVSASAPAAGGSAIANDTQPAGAPPAGIAPNGTPPNGTPPAGAPNGTPPQGSVPNGTAPAGMMPGGSSGGASYNLSGAYTVDGTTATGEGRTYTSDTTDVSAVYVTNGGDLTLVNPTIRTTGNTTSNDASSFYGLNAGVLAAANGTVTIVGGSIETSGTGANGAFPSGSGASISLSNVTITATGGGGHGVMASGGGHLALSDTDITTAGANSAPIATDRGGGTVTVTGGTVVSSGRDSPGIYSTGLITVDGGTISATGSEAAVIEGSNSITLTNTALVGSEGTRDRGIMVYQSMSGDAETGLGTFTMTGGSYDWTSSTGPAFYVTNTNATITLSGVKVTSNAEELLNASAGAWGTAGSNGGTVLFTADNEALNGSLVADGISSITAVLRNGTTLSGAIGSAALSLDATSTWTLTGDSVLTTLSDAAGISGSAITNIIGNGHTVRYDAGLAGNSALGGKTFSLVNGGTLTPATAGTVTMGSTPAANASESGSTGGSGEYTGALTSTVAATTTATATATTTPAATGTLLPGLTTGTATPETTWTGTAAETPAGATATRMAAATATATTQAGFDALPLAAGALAIGAPLVAARRR